MVTKRRTSLLLLSGPALLPRMGRRSSTSLGSGRTRQRRTALLLLSSLALPRRMGRPSLLLLGSPALRMGRQATAAQADHARPYERWNREHSERQQAAQKEEQKDGEEVGGRAGGGHVKEGRCRVRPAAFCSQWACWGGASES